MATSSPFSLRLDPDLKARLEAEARAADRSASYMASQAIKTWLDHQAAKRQAISAALREADKGRFVSRKAMADWVESWGQAEELPKPEIDISGR